MLRVTLLHLAAALAEIAGCYAFWGWLRLDRPAWWLVPGLAALAGFAWLLTLSPAEHAGRAYAAYGGIYIACALAWGRIVEDNPADRWDLAGAALSLAGAAVILFAPRG